MESAKKEENAMSKHNRERRLKKAILKGKAAAKPGHSVNPYRKSPYRDAWDKARLEATL
jgi:hypothetical protein